MKKYNKMITLYHKYNKAHHHIIGFTFEGWLYIVTLKKIPHKLIKVMRGSHNRGKKLQLNITQKNKKWLINKKQATPVATVDSFTNIAGYNKGDKLEYLLRRQYNIPHQHDTVPFYKGVDMVINGVGYSIKYENGQLALYSTLKRLARQGGSALDMRERVPHATT